MARHHRAVHEEGYPVDQESGGGRVFRRPDDRKLPAVPPLALVPEEPVESAPRAARGTGNQAEREDHLRPVAGRAA